MARRRKGQKTSIFDCGDGHHQVATVTSKNDGPLIFRRRICDECPWRKDAPIGAFPASAYRHSAITAYDMSQNLFSCHMQGIEKGAVCNGFLNANAEHNLAIRLAIATGRFDFADLPESPVELYGSYREMAEANGVDPDDAALRLCRPNRGF